jgi:hypothetical protein
MILFYTLVALWLVFHGAIYGRLDGGGTFKPPELVERILIMYAFVVACSIEAGAWSFLAAAGGVGIATGHGQYFLQLRRMFIRPEYFDFLLTPFFGKDPRTTQAVITLPENHPDIEKAVNDYGIKKLYWRCVAGMFVTGTIVGLPAFVILAFYVSPYSLLFLLTGVLKSLSYMFAWRFFKSTVPAEYINGGGRNALCLLVILLTIINN